MLARLELLVSTPFYVAWRKPRATGGAESFYLFHTLEWNVNIYSKGLRDMVPYGVQG